MRLGLGVALLFLASTAGATPPVRPVVVAPPKPVVAPPAPAPHVAPRAAEYGAAPPPTSSLYAAKKPEETTSAFIERAAHEIPTQVKATPRGREAVETLARAAGFEAIRKVVVGGGVVGSQSGNSYVLYYKNGWTDANLRPPPKPVANSAPAPAPSPEPTAHRDPELESQVRAMLAKAPDGQRALEHLADAKTTILFREGGGTSNNGDKHELYVDTKMMDGRAKPVSWLALSVAHEASHAHDDATGATPRTVSPLHDEYAKKKAETNVPMTLRVSLVDERHDYVDRQVAGEARAMTTETRLRKDLEAQGVDFQRLGSNLLDPYNQAYAKVYADAGLSP